MLVAAGRDQTINAKHVGYLRWDRREGRHSTLIVTMLDGSEIRVPHEPNWTGGNDAYQIERDIIAAANG